MDDETQEIFLERSDLENSYEIHSRDVKIFARSPKKCIDNKRQYHHSQWITSHFPSAIYARIFKDSDSKLRVDVVNKNVQSVLYIDGFDGDILTIQFSTYATPLLAVLCSDGKLHVYHVQPSNAQCSLIYSVELDIKADTCYLQWGPLVFANTEEKHKIKSLLLAATVNRKLFIFDFNGVAELLSLNSPRYLNTSTIEENYKSCERLFGRFDKELSCRDLNIGTLNFTSDASILLVGSDNGEISMFKVSEEGDEVSMPCRTFRPHGNIKLCSCHIVDFITRSAGMGYVITGAKNNSELYLWQLHDQRAVQLINFKSKTQQNPILITRFDRDTNLLVAIDVTRDVLYVLHLAGSVDPDEDLQFRCVSEFILEERCFDFEITNIGRTHRLDDFWSHPKGGGEDCINIDLLVVFPTKEENVKIQLALPISTYLGSSISNSPPTEIPEAVNKSALKPSVNANISNIRLPAIDNLNDIEMPTPASTEERLQKSQRTQQDVDVSRTTVRYSTLDRHDFSKPNPAELDRQTSYSNIDITEKPNDLTNSIAQLMKKVSYIQSVQNQILQSITNLASNQTFLPSSDVNRAASTPNWALQITSQLQRNHNDTNQCLDRMEEALVKLTTDTMSSPNQMGDSLCERYAEVFSSNLQNRLNSMSATLEVTVKDTLTTELQNFFKSQFTATLEKEFADFRSHVQVELKSHLQSVSEKVDEALNNKVDKATRELETPNAKLKDSASPQVPSAATPVLPPAHASAPTKDAELARNAAQIYGLIRNRQFSEALQKALLANNINLLCDALQKMSPVEVFRQGVDQTMLIPLIYQLSCSNLREFMKVKFSYLELGVERLDIRHPSVKQHYERILLGLSNKLTALFAGDNLDQEAMNQIAMLLDVVEQKK